MNNRFNATILISLPANSLAIMAGGLMSLFSTHPPTEERIARYESLACRRGTFILPRPPL